MECKNLEVKRKKDGFGQFDDKVRYDTYAGPHYPPEGPESFTFSVFLQNFSKGGFTIL